MDKKKINAMLTIFALFAILGINYFGFCYHQMRILSNEEKIKIVAAHILARYPKPGAVHEQLNAGSSIPRWSTVKTWPENPIPYHDMNEFFLLNPNCCQVTTNYKSIGGEGISVSCWSRLMGFESSIVGVRYFLRYLDDEGAVQTKLIEIFPTISNCGELGWSLT